MLGNAIPGEHAPVNICNYDEAWDVPEMEEGDLCWKIPGSSRTPQPSTSVSLLNNNSSRSFPRGVLQSSLLETGRILSPAPKDRPHLENSLPSP